MKAVLSSLNRATHRNVTAGRPPPHSFGSGALAYHIDQLSDATNHSRCFNRDYKKTGRGRALVSTLFIPAQGANKGGFAEVILSLADCSTLRSQVKSVTVQTHRSGSDRQAKKKEKEELYRHQKILQQCNLSLALVESLIHCFFSRPTHATHVRSLLRNLFTKFGARSRPIVRRILALLGEGHADQNLGGARSPPPHRSTSNPQWIGRRADVTRLRGQLPALG
jgi:hypothetical protein